MTNYMWRTPDVLHVICTQLHSAHFSVHVGDSSPHSEETVKNLDLWLSIRSLLLLLLFLLSILLFFVLVCKDLHYVKVTIFLNTKLCLKNYVNIGQILARIYTILKWRFFLNSKLCLKNHVNIVQIFARIYIKVTFFSKHKILKIL